MNLTFMSHYLIIASNNYDVSILIWSSNKS